MCAIDQIPPPRAGKAMLRARTCIGEARVIIDGLARDEQLWHLDRDDALRLIRIATRLLVKAERRLGRASLLSQ